MRNLIPRFISSLNNNKLSSSIMPSASSRSDPITTDSPNQMDSKLNDIIIGNGLCGVLQKWVNYGKGWKPRWFVLEDGVVSYYKIHGHHKIVVDQDTFKGFRIIGDDSNKRIGKAKKSGGAQIRDSTPVGEVHLKVSSIRESRSDDKRFSIFTGTKRLHMRADTHEDRQQWLEALHAVKGMFPRMSNSELTSPMDNITVSTEKLRQRLLEEGVSEEAIQDSEQIMRNEFASLQNQLILVRQKHWLMIDTLRHLEVHKMTNRKKHATRFRNSSSVSSAQNASQPTFHSIP